MNLTIKPATEDDVIIIHDLVVAPAVFERKPPEEILVTTENLKRWGFGEQLRPTWYMFDWKNPSTGIFESQN